MTFYDNGVLEYIAVLPAGDYEYKIALNDDWGEAYPGENVSLSVPENNTRVIFRYDSFTHQVADSINNPSEFPAVALVGTIITDTTTRSNRLNPSNENTELEYMGGGIYKFSAFVLAGNMSIRSLSMIPGMYRTPGATNHCQLQKIRQSTSIITIIPIL